jgi:hypothetical protein
MAQARQLVIALNTGIYDARKAQNACLSHFGGQSIRARVVPGRQTSLLKTVVSRLKTAK